MAHEASGGVSRRGFLGRAGSVAAGAASLSLLPGTVQKALRADPEPLRSLDQIEHFVFLMQKNRSFDHYFGTLPGVAGFDDPDAMRLPNGESVFRQPDAVHPDGHVLPFRLDTTTTSSAAVHTTTHGWGPQHLSWHDGRMDTWMPAHRAADGDEVGPLAMGYHTREDLPATATRPFPACRTRRRSTSGSWRRSPRCRRRRCRGCSRCRTRSGGTGRTRPEARVASRA